MSISDNHPAQRSTRSSWILRGCGFLAVSALIAVFIPAFWRANGGHHASCANHLKQIGLSLKMYANEDPEEFYPTLSREPGRLMFDGELMYPEYLPDPLVIISPDDDDYERFRLNPDEQYIQDPIDPDIVIDDWSYFYLRYAVRNDYDMQRYAMFYRESHDHGRDGSLDEDWYADRTAGDPAGLRVLYRLREDVDRMVGAMTEDGLGNEIDSLVRSEIPILIERIGNHRPDGAHVLYLDGHVEFIEYPGKWPMTETTVRILNELDALGDVLDP